MKMTPRGVLKVHGVKKGKGDNHKKKKGPVILLNVMNGGGEDGGREK